MKANSKYKMIKVYLKIYGERVQKFYTKNIALNFAITVKQNIRQSFYSQVKVGNLKALVGYLKYEHNFWETPAFRWGIIGERLKF